MLAIPVKRTDQKLIGSVTRPASQALLAALDRATWVGRRNQALLVPLYNSGARVSEITTLKQGQIRCAEHTCVRLVGKGRQERPIPLCADPARLLRGWGQEVGEAPAHGAFPSARGTSLARAGVEYLLKQISQRTVASCPGLATQAISPHGIRHTTAMPRLQAGVAMATSALWVGHASIETTQMYLQADLARKEKALEKLEPIEGAWQRCHADEPWRAFLAAL